MILIRSNDDFIRKARIAGLLYLVIIVFGIGAEVALRGPLIDLGNASSTAEAILGSVGAFRLSIAADLIMAVCDAGLAVLLFGLLYRVAPMLALAAMVFRLLQTVMIGMNLMNMQAAWLIVSGGQDIVALPPDQANALAVLFLNMHAHGYDLGLFFFGINSLMTGVLIWQSGYVPRSIGAGLCAAGIVYLTGSGLRFFAPELAPAIAPAYLIPIVAETVFCLWLLLARKTGLQIRLT